MSPLRSSPRGTVLQVAHVVHDLETSVADWVRTQHAGPFFRAHFQIDGHTYRGQPHRVNLHVAIGFLGSTIVELAQPADAAPSLFREVLEQRGEGLHHLLLQVENFDDEIARYGRAGCPVVGSGMVPGVGRNAFVDTTRSLGCFVELFDMSDGAWTMLERIRDAHVGWRGEDPLRPYPAL